MASMAFCLLYKLQNIAAGVLVQLLALCRHQQLAHVRLLLGTGRPQVHAADAAAAAAGGAGAGGAGTGWCKDEYTLPRRKGASMRIS